LGQPITNTGHLERVHFYMTFQKDEAKVFYCGLSRCALLTLDVEPMLVEDVEDTYYNGMMLLLGLATED